MARDRARERLAERVLGDPEFYPPEFKANLPRILQDNLNLQVQKQQIPGATGEGWKTVGGVATNTAFTSPWRHYQAGATSYGVVRFFKDYIGFVHLDGVAETTGTPGSDAIFALPAGYRPSQSLILDVRAAPGGAEAPARLDIVPSTGLVRILTGYANYTSGSWISLCNIHFRAA